MFVALVAVANLCEASFRLGRDGATRTETRCVIVLSFWRSRLKLSTGLTDWTWSVSIMKDHHFLQSVVAGHQRYCIWNIDERFTWRHFTSLFFEEKDVEFFLMTFYCCVCMFLCVCMHVSVRECMRMFLSVCKCACMCLCVWVQACPCHRTCMEVRGQLRVSCLTFSLAWKQHFLLITMYMGLAGPRLFSDANAHLVMRLQGLQAWVCLNTFLFVWRGTLTKAALMKESI